MAGDPGSAAGPPTRGEWAFGLAVAALPAAAVALLARVPGTWGGWREATCMPDACFCEAIRADLVRQPTNTVSSLAFLPFAAIILRRAFRASQEPGGQPRQRGLALPAMYGLALGLLGLGSAFFHASLTFLGQTTDVLGMYLIVTFALVHHWTRLGRVSDAGIAARYVGLNAVLLAGLVALPELRRWAFAALVILGVGLEYRDLRSPGTGAARYLAGAVVLLALGFGVWVADLTGVLCAPRSPFQGHGLWHLLAASSAGMLYLFFESECGPREGGAVKLAAAPPPS